MTPRSQNSSTPPHIVVIGAGFAGLSAARRLKGVPAQITVVDRRNHHLFQPLLYQVATAGLSPAQIAAPIRSILRDLKNCEVILDEVTGIDRAHKRVHLQRGTLTYDYLIVATGAVTHYFGHDEWEQWAPSLKSVEDATEIRRRVLRAFEVAESEPNPDAQDRILNFVVVGGGPTGVEVAGTIAELSMKTLCRDFRHIDPSTAHVYLIEAGPRILPTFAEKLSLAAQRKLEKMGVRVHLNERVTHIDQNGVTTDNHYIPTQAVIWAAGVVASPVGRWLGVEADRRGRVPVTGYLTLKDDPSVYILGDLALVADDTTGQPLPGTAPVAMQQGRYVADALKLKIGGREPEIRPFQYFDKGTMATVGRSFAVAEIGRLKIDGLIAWLLWCAIHVLYLIGFRNRLLVLIEWMWAYFTYQRGARLIVGYPQDQAHKAGGQQNKASQLTT